MRVAIYIRVSTEDQAEKWSLPAQERLLTELAQARGWEYEVFRDVGSGTTLQRRHGLQELLSRLAEFDAVLVVDLDRLARPTDLGEWAMLKGLLRRANVKVITPQAEYSFTDDQDDFVSDILAVIAKWERNTILRRMARGYEEYVKQGGMWGRGRRVYGYRFDGEKFIPVPEEWGVVKEIYQLAKYWGVPRIAEYLNQQGIPSPRGKKWRDSTIRAMLLNPIYGGRAVWRKRPTGKHNLKNPVSTGIEHWVFSPIPVVEPVVSWEEWWMICQKMAMHPCGRPAVFTYYLRGIVKCPRCGRGMVGRGSPKRGAKLYGCPRIKECYPHLLSANKVEWFLPQLYEMVKQSKEVKEKIRELVQKDLPSPSTDTLQKRLAVLEEARQRVIDLYLENIISRDEMEKKMEEIKKKKELVETELHAVERDQAIQRIHNLMEVIEQLVWDDLTEEMKQEFCQLVIERVEIDPKTKHITSINLFPLFTDIAEKLSV